MREKRETPETWFSDLALLILAVAGFAINQLLLIHDVSDASFGIAGCSGSGCEKVLSSRWSRIFGIPVTVPGMFVYLGLMISVTSRGVRLLAPLIGVIAGSTLWFVFAQGVLVREFCPWCLIAHGIGALAVWAGISRRMKQTIMPFALKGIAPFAAATFFGIGLVQLYGPVPEMHRVESIQSARKPAAVHSRGKGRVVKFDGGRWVYNASDLPHIGPDQATRVLVEYFDYQCPACRTMRGYLAALAAKYPRDICVVMLPVPLEGACNRSLDPSDAGHPGSCDFTRLALAIWRFKPARFQEFHEAVLEGMPLAEADRMAEEILTPQNRDAALRDPWIDELVAANIADWVSLSETTRHLPKLLIRRARILHGLPSGEADFIRVMEQELELGGH